MLLIQTFFSQNYQGMSIQKTNTHTNLKGIMMYIKIENEFSIFESKADGMN